MVSEPVRCPKRPLSTDRASLSTSKTTAMSSSSAQSMARNRQSSKAAVHVCNSPLQARPSPNNSCSTDCSNATHAAQVWGRLNCSSIRAMRSNSVHHRTKRSGSNSHWNGAAPAGANPSRTGNTRPKSQRSKHQRNPWVSSPPRSVASSPQRKPVCCKTRVIRVQSSDDNPCNS